jgi:hypothetical protein
VIEDSVPTSGMMAARVAMAAPEAISVFQRIASEAAIPVAMVWLVVLLGTSTLVVKSHSNAGSLLNRTRMAPVHTT